MKIRINFTDPDGVSYALDEAAEESQLNEGEGTKEEHKEALKGMLKKWVRYGEYCEVEFDTETGTATVIPAQR